MSPDDKKEVSEMCNVSRGVLDKGMTLGRKEGITLGRKEGITLGRKEGMTLGREEGITLGMDKSTLNSISKMVATFNVTIDQAMDILEVPDEKREYYKTQISE